MSVFRFNVVFPWDLTLNDWPERAAIAGIRTLGMHAARGLTPLLDFQKTDAAARFHADCRKYGIAVEYELHAPGELLSRELFYKDTSLFRALKNGNRSGDHNGCHSSRDALEIIVEKAVEYGRILKPNSGRFYYWADDGKEAGWCFCKKCRGLTSSDQVLIVENAILKGLRQHVDPGAALCHFAYHRTLEPPENVPPEPGIFLEFAPIRRSYDCSIAHRSGKVDSKDWNVSTHGDYLDLLDRNLEVFPGETTQILEYWLDVSFFSKWRRPAVVLPWNQEMLSAQE